MKHCGNSEDEASIFGEDFQEFVKIILLMRTLLNSVICLNILMI